MSDAVPDALTAVPPPRDRRMVVTAAISAVLHLALLLWLVLPRVALPEPAEPAAVNVDLVPPSQLSSMEPPSSSLAPSSQASSAEAPSSAEAASSAPASSAEASSPEPASSAESASSVEPASSAGAEAPTSLPASQAASSQAASEPPSSIAPPTPLARPIVIPVGPSAESSAETSSAADASAPEDPSSAASEIASAETSSAASKPEQASALTTTDSHADAVAETSSEAEAASAEPIPPSLTGALHAAKRYYLEAMLNAPAMEKAREAIKKLPPEKRLAQTCNIEAVGQIGNTGKGYEPDALVANAFAKPVIAGNTFTVTGGAFRSKQKWFGIAYTCTLSDDMSAVKSFSFRVGADVTAELKARVGD